MQTTTIGVDLSKSVFQLSLADERHHIINRRRLSRSRFSRFIAHTPPSKLVMEGCASAHHWGRMAQSNGHQVKLLHAHYVRPYVRRDKTDAADADALLRADQDHELRPIPVKSEQQQALQSLHRIRAQWRSALTGRINEARGLLGEFGIVLPRGTRSIGHRLHAVMHELPDLLQPAFSELISEISQLKERLTRLQQWALHTQQRAGHNKATVALANKLARIAWAVWTKGIKFDGNDARRFD